MTDGEPIYQLVYLPYISLDDELTELRFGDVTIWNADQLLEARVPNTKLRDRVDALLNMNRPTANIQKRRSRVRGIGVVTIGDDPLRELSKEETARIEEVRIAVFLAGLDFNTSIKRNANAGHSMYTAENFSVVYQRFRLSTDFVAEQSGVIISFNLMGLEISKTVFPKPSYVNTPHRSGLNRGIVRELEWLRQADSTLSRRVIRASTEFLGSYYNTPSVDVNSRIFAQMMAFEILLDIPEINQRKEFKDRLQRLCDDENEPQLTYESERGPQRTEQETRSVKGMWADQAYTLRNHLIHGQEVSSDEFLFRGHQHHVLAGSVLFMCALKRTINNARVAAGDKPRFYDKVAWETWADDHDHPPSERQGFAVVSNYFADAAVKKGMTPQEYLNLLMPDQKDDRQGS